MRYLLAILICTCLTASAQVAPKDWMPEARDVELYHWPTNKPVQLYREVKAVSRDVVAAFPTAEDPADAPEMLTLAWDSGYQLGAGEPTGFILWLDSGNGAIRILTTNTLSVDVPYAEGTYYVSATNRFGMSAFSTGLTVPKPTTNVYTFSASVTNWPAQVWQVQNLPAPQEWFRVRYAPTNGQWRASCVFAANRSDPPDAWQIFIPWPPFLTTNRDIALHLTKAAR